VYFCKKKNNNMEAITLFAETPIQSKALKALAEALNVKWAVKQLSKKEMLVQLEGQLSPKQLAWWTDLKETIRDVESGKAEKTTWEDFLKELDDENLLTPTVQA
jgi:hypothetical protein